MRIHTQQAGQHGAEMILMDWKARLRLRCSRAVDLVVTSSGQKGSTAE